MSKSDFLPRSDRDYLAWYDNFIAQLQLHREDTGVTEEELAALVADNAELHAKMSALDIAAAAHKHATAEKDSIRDASETHCRSTVRRIKAQTKYSHALGALLNIESAANSTDLSTAKPTLTGVDQTGGIVTLAFNKSNSDGVNIYCQREGDTDWVLIGHASSSPFTDSRPLLVTGKPELRRYCAVYTQKQSEIGLFSDEVVVNCAP